MSPRDWRNRVRDILDAIYEIQKFTRGMSYEAFKGDTKSVRVVEMNFIIIGEGQTKFLKMLKKNIQRSPESHACHAESHCTRIFQC